MILAVVWIISALLGAGLAAYFLHGAFPWFTMLWLLVPLIAVLRSRDAKRIGFSAVRVKDFLAVTTVNVAAQIAIVALFDPWSHAGQRLYELALSSPAPDATFLWPQRFAGAAGWIGMVAYSALVTLFAEELFFRGWLTQWLLRRLRPMWAILVQATIFTLLVNLIVAFFMSPLQATIHLLVYSWLAIGVVNGWAAVRTRSIWPGLIAVVLSNLLGVVIVGTHLPPTPIPPTAASPAAMELPAEAESLPFAGTSSEFNTLGEFDRRMKSALASGEVDSFWQTVEATGQMPLVFGDSIAVFLYRGQAESVVCRGDFAASYRRQGETDLWAFIRPLEPDARLEYQIMLNSRVLILDPKNPLTETGGLGTKSVVQKPKYVVPEFALPRGDIAHGTFGENVTLSSQFLGYDVDYRVYAPVGYETLANLPVIYVTDGQDYAHQGMGALVNALDSLIADGQIKPILAVFIDPRDPTTGANRREKELVSASLASCPFCDFVARELVPTIDSAYKTNPCPTPAPF